MLRILLVAAALLVAVVAGVLLVVVVGLRRHSPAVRRLVRGVARRFVNPRVLRTAGTPGATTSVVHHVGRATGTPYRTPVEAVRADDGFVVALPYGTSSNWVRNVLAAGSAVLVDDGVRHRVDHPEIVPLASVAALFPAADLRTLRRFRVQECIRLRTGGPVPSGVAGDPPEEARA
jgi:deazaflavin-dependent oxidoreductase (nitroreductase family)